MTRLQVQKRKRGCRPNRNRTIRSKQRSQRRRTMGELKKIALDIHRGEVWTDRAMPPELVGNCFPILMFMDPKTQREVRETVGKRGMIFEYARKAAPMGVNGYPMFFSMGVLSSGESSIVIEILRDLSAAENEVLN